MIIEDKNLLNVIEIDQVTLMYNRYHMNAKKKQTEIIISEEIETYITITITTWTNMYAEFLLIIGTETIKNPIVNSNELFE
jgi:hypothetical protein